jgi:hypothetical protein
MNEVERYWMALGQLGAVIGLLRGECINLGDSRENIAALLQECWKAFSACPPEWPSRAGGAR